MSDELNHPDENDLDRATAARLRKLAARPVELGRLERAMVAKLSSSNVSAPTSPLKLWRGGPLRAVAAGILLTLLAGLILAVVVKSTSPAMAEPTSMASLHQQLVDGKAAMTRVSSAHEATRVLETDWPGMPSLPSLPEDHSMACCLKEVKGRRVVCVVISDGSSAPVSVVVAPRGDLKSPGGRRAHAVGNVNMLMVEHGDRWVCLMTTGPVEQLERVAKGMGL